MVMRQYQEDVETLNKEAHVSSKQTSALEDMCEVLLDRWSIQIESKQRECSQF